jgi:hypothetical protein
MVTAALSSTSAGRCPFSAISRANASSTPFVASTGMRAGLGGGDLLDLHTALDRAHRQVGAVGAVEQEGDVILLGDVAGLGHQQLLDDVALDVEPEDVLGVGERVVGGGRVLHAAGLAAAAGLHLSLDHDGLADLLGDRLGVLRRVGHPAGRGRDVVLGEELFRLVLKKIHGPTCLCCVRSSVTSRGAPDGLLGTLSTRASGVGTAHRHVVDLTAARQ